jgi:flagellin
MALTVNTNVAALNGQNNLSKSQASLSTSMARLSSGLRINSSKDDSAGLAISERFTAQIRGNDQAARNANDGISLAQTAEGDLEQIGASLQRIRELAVQSSNATNNASDRKSINNEATQLIAEIDRVATNSSFNGTNLLDGSFSAKSFQVGANNTANDRITIASISSARSSALGVGSGSSYSTAKAGAVVTNTALVAGDIAINGYNVGASTSDGVSFSGGNSSAISKAAAINAVSGQTGVTASVAATTAAGTIAGAGAAVAAGTKINGVDIGVLAATATVADRGSQTAAAVNAVTSQTGVTAASDSTGLITLTAVDGRNITVDNSSVDTGLGGAVGVVTTTSKINLSSSSSAGITLSGTAGLAAAGLGAAGYTAATTTAGAGVSSLDLTTTAGAQSALDVIDAAISTINTTRGTLGSFQNRFESAVSTLSTKTENLSASRGRIRDADFAKESANLSRSQVLQQAGTAMLSQANQSAQGVLSLLR